jgi:hypothetical protein
VKGGKVGKEQKQQQGTLERVWDLKKTGSRVTFVVAKLQSNDQTVY